MQLSKATITAISLLLGSGCAEEEAALPRDGIKPKGVALTAATGEPAEPPPHHEGDGVSALGAALLEGRYDAARTLLSKGADPNTGLAGTSWQAPLLFAAGKGESGLIDLLATYNARIDVVDARGQTALHCAAYADRAKAASRLLALGLQVDAKGPLGRTPLHVAAQFGSSECVALFLSQGADANAADQLGRTPAHLAAESGNADIAGTLARLLRGQPLADAHSLTPLHLACAFGHDSVVSNVWWFTRAPNSLSSGGHTPAHWAALSGNRACLQALDWLGPAQTGRSNSSYAPNDYWRELSTGTNGPQTAGRELESWETSWGGEPPVLALVTGMGSGYAPFGLIAACWEDGFVLFSEEAANPGKSIRWGEVEPKLIQAIVVAIGELSLEVLSHKRGIQPDEPAVQCILGDYRFHFPWRVLIGGVDSPQDTQERSLHLALRLAGGIIWSAMPHGMSVDESTVKIVRRYDLEKGVASW